MMLRSKSTLLFLLLFSLLKGSFSQQLQFEQFTTKNGLPSNQLYTLIQDKKGYIWICTNYGITRYNGTTFQPVCTNIPFNEQFAYCMHEDKTGQIWFANSQANVYRIKNDSAFKVQGLEEVSAKMRRLSSEIYAIMIDEKGDLYITTKLDSYVLKDGTQVLNVSEKLADGKHDFSIIENDNFLQAVKLKNQHAKDAKDLFVSINGFGVDSSCRVLEPLHEGLRYVRKINGKVYATNHNAIIAINGKKDTEITRFEHRVISLQGDKKGNVWVGCYNGGLFQLDKGSKKLQHYFSNYSVNSILFDNQEGLWISTSGHGLFHCKNVNDMFYVDHPNLTEVITLTKVIDSILFIGTSGGHLYQMNGNLKEIELPEDVHVDVTDIGAFGKGYIVASKGGVFKTDKEFSNFKGYKFEDKINVLAYEIANVTDSSFYYMTRVGIGRIENGEAKVILELDAKINCFISFSSTEFLIGTNNGLYHYNEVSGKIDHIEETKSINVQALKKFKENEIWVCTRGFGLFSINKNFKMEFLKDVPSPIVTDVYFPSPDRMLISGNKGVYLSEKGVDGFGKFWRRLFDEETNTIVQFKEQIFIGSNYGLVALDLDQRSSSRGEPVYVTKVMGGETLFLSPPYDFTYEQRNLEFNFDLLDYRSVERSFFYTLQGPVNQAGTFKGNSLSFNNMPPGKYELIVGQYRTTSTEGVKSIKTVFTVKPTFWQTPLFIWGLAVAGVILLYNAFLFINKKAKIREEKRMEVQRMLAEYKLTAIKAQINPHFISNSLAAIQELVIKGEIDRAGQYLARFSLLIRSVLKYSDRSIVKLSEELDVIDLNIELESLRFRNVFDFYKVIEPGVDVNSIFVPPLITQPFIENAIWHGLLPLKNTRKAKLFIRISRKDEELIITIEDNGVGRGNKNISTESKGSALIRNRLENINLLFGINTARVEMEDLLDPAGEPAGTKAHIIFPYLLSDEHEYNKNNSH